ncbi:superoxide dismutase [Mn], mitochondrial isoform X2 [Halyomorpha halys]|uniref:superoxide dismutase [Mn], mitochondrial isoform X2 n=1 Tax=Halyomorpha halys TaxID=286706 RepID=UPI0006D4DF30|nr:superoxide dismutase [Mn], mitochondrial isoform X2 [Halyomorpha halys]
MQQAARAALSKSVHTLPELPYASNALEPVISQEIMELHHKKHHNAYVTNFNAAEEQLKEALQKNDISKAVSLQPALRFNGGGHINHSIFWKNLSPDGGKPSSELCTALDRDFGGVDNFRTQLQALSNGIQGSGWGWLGYNKVTKRLQLAACANQDPLQPTTGLIPLFGIDVWEHAYYLQYRNVRADYTKKIFDIINWVDVSERFKKASS